MEKENYWKLRKDYDRKRDLLGQGGFGTVFKGILVHRRNEKVEETEVAIKRIEKARILNETSAAQQAAISVNRELVQKKLNHPNVVKLLFVDDEEEDFLYFALELCEASLEKVFLPENHPKKYRGPLPNDADFMLQLSLGLDYIHSQKLVHRDIKPENVLISTSTEQVIMKWADFGLSKATTSRGECVMSGVRGTDIYWAPEIFVLIRQKESILPHMEMNMNMTIMTDVFACGCLFYQFLTKGTHPFGSDYHSIIDNLRQTNPIVNQRDLPSYHFAYNAVSKMLSTQVEERLNLKEIIPLLISIHRIMKNSTTQQLFNEAHQKMIKDIKELYKLCSMPNPTVHHIKKLTQIVTEDSIGLVNTVDENGSSPLLLLCQNNQSASLLQCIRVMTIKSHNRGMQERDIAEIVQEIDIRYQDRKGNNALHYICMNYKGDDLFEIIELLVHLGTNNATRYSNSNGAVDVIKAKASNGRTPLHYLCRYCDKNNLIYLTRFMIENGVDIKAKAKGDVSYDWTVLHVVCRWYTHYNLIDLVRLLIEKGVEVNAKTSEGITALHAVCGHYTHDNLIDLVRLLIEKGVEVNAKTSDGWTALHAVCRHYTHDNLIDLVRLLIGKGVEVNAKTSEGVTALHFVCRHYTHDNLIDLVRLLIEKGVEVNAKTSDGWTALHFVCRHYTHDNLIDLVRLLIEKGVEVNAKTSEGVTALHAVCRHYTHDNLIDLVRLLIEKGVEVNAKISEGWTALDLLRSHYTHKSNSNLVKLLGGNLPLDARNNCEIL